MRVPGPRVGGAARILLILVASVVGVSATVARWLKNTTPSRCPGGRPAAKRRADAMAAVIGAPRIDVLVSMPTITADLPALAGTTRRPATAPPFSLTRISPARR